MNTLYNDSTEKASGRAKWNRDDVVSKVVEFEKAKHVQSQRQWAGNQGIPRSTLQHWIKRKQTLDASPALVGFFESPDGLAFLHRVVIAAHFAFTKDGVASIHNMSNFLELSGLDQFVASSYGSQRTVSKKMDDAIIDFAKCEQKRLSRQMCPKSISLCEDETFHPEVCLVAMEPVSNFIIAEKYVANREAKTWNQTLGEALSDLPVKVVQVASDEGRGLINHIEKGLNAHHCSDLFHVCHEIGKGTSGALASEVRSAERQYQRAVKKTEYEKRRKQRYDNRQKRPRGRRPAFEKHIFDAVSQQQQAEAGLAQARRNQETARTAKAEIGKIYHPYDPATGIEQRPEKVLSLLESCFAKINQAAETLSDRCKKHIDKAHRVVGNMTATIAFFFSMIELYMENMNFSIAQQQLMREHLIPGFYLQQVAHREKDPQRKQAISEKSQALLSVIYNRDGPLSGYNKEQIRTLEKSAKECAQLFQRSSSCVEGRNAQLSLRHHGIHKLSNRHLKAQTAIHNYYIKRPDRTTAAERLFGAKPKDIFEWLLDSMDLPARPRKPLRKAA